MSGNLDTVCQGVWSGVLPLKLNSGTDQRELARARLLLRSLGHFWRDTRPFDLHIIARTEEVDEIKRELSDLCAPPLNVRCHAETDFFPIGSPFFSMEGMYRQQLLKLFAPAKMTLGGFLTLDADVICLREFDSQSFLRGGKLISTWEPRHIHSWWQNSAAGLRIWSDQNSPGLGVTPNVLHSDLCRKIERYFAFRGLDPIQHLCSLTEHHPNLTSIDGEGIPLVWSEYSIYTIIGEWFGDLFKLHLAPAESEKSGVELHSRRNVWSSADAGRLIPDPEDAGHFLIVQSWAGISVEEIQARIGLRFSPAPAIRQ